MAAGDMAALDDDVINSVPADEYGIPFPKHQLLALIQMVLPFQDGKGFWRRGGKCRQAQPVGLFGWR